MTCPSLDQFGGIVAVDAAGHDQAVCLHDVEGLMGGVVDDDAHAVLLLCDVGLKEVQQVMGVDAVECLLTALVEEVADFLDDRLTLDPQTKNAPR